MARQRDEGREQGGRKRWDARDDSGPTHEDVIVSISIPSGNGRTGGAGNKPDRRVAETQRQRDVSRVRVPSCALPLTYCASLFTGPGDYSGHCGLGALGGGRRGSPSPGIRVSRKRPCPPVKTLVCRPCFPLPGLAGEFPNHFALLYRDPQGVQGGKGKDYVGFRVRNRRRAWGDTDVVTQA